MTTTTTTTENTQASDLCVGDIINISAWDYEITLDTVTAVIDTNHGGIVAVQFAVAGAIIMNGHERLTKTVERTRRLLTPENERITALITRKWDEILYQVEKTDLPIIGPIYAELAYAMATECAIIGIELDELAEEIMMELRTRGHSTGRAVRLIYRMYTECGVDKL